MSASVHVGETVAASSPAQAVGHPSLKRSVGIAAAAGFSGTFVSLVVMFLFPNNPFALWADILTGQTSQLGGRVQPLGWVFHSALVTLWSGLYGALAAWKGVRRVYVSAVGWGLLAWLWTLALIAAYGLLSPAVAFIELAAYLVIALVLAAGYSYGVWGTIEPPAGPAVG